MNGDYVLILGSNTLERDVLTGMLHSEGYRVFSTDCPLTARKIIYRFPVDAVLVDRGFRADETLAFLAFVQAHHPQVARVLMTPDPRSRQSLRAMGLGHTHSLLLKPVIESELFFSLTRALRKARVFPEPASLEDETFPAVGFFSHADPGHA
jgi:DNA-binding NtrC family response regulator